MSYSKYHYLNTIEEVNMEHNFDNIYKTNHWISGSGPGSTIAYNKDVYIPFLKQFIIDNNIKTVADLGCGDCQCLENTYNDLNIKYTGYDCVYTNVIENNLNNIQNDKYSFVHLDIFKNRENIIAADVCVLKDILCHWKLECIYIFLDYLVSCQKFKYILLINCCQQSIDNTDIQENGNFHPLSCDFFPLKRYKAQKLCNYNSKEISVINVVMNNIFHVFSQDLLPKDHINFLENVLHNKFKINPQVIYDIGACCLHWERHGKRLWPDSKIYCFDAFSCLEELYKQQNINYNICCLSDVDNSEVKFYQNDMLFGGNSIFKEINDDVFPEQSYVIKKTITLDTIVNKNNIPYPDLIKIDVQGCELNILKGASQVLKCCSYLILELQEIVYNKGAPLKDEVIEYLKTVGFVLFCEKFSKNIADADYCFVNALRTNVVMNSLN